MDLIAFTQGGIARQAEREVLLANEYLFRYGDGIVLSEKDARMLVESRSRALRSYGRVEFGGGSVAMLAKKFCASPNINKSEFAEVLSDVVEIFYAFKNETEGKVSDEELAEAMAIAFDGSCHGSVALLATKNPRELVRIVLSGRDMPHDDDLPLDGETEENGDAG